MNDYRLRYAKFGLARFASHLDLGRALGRSLRRAGLPVAYSRGFHPLPKMAFGPPLPVGVESEAEFVDITFTEELEEREIARRLNVAFPPGLMITGVLKLPLKAPSLMRLIDRFTYIFLFSFFTEANAAEWNQEKISAFLAALWRKEELPVVRKKQGRERTVNLRPFWYNYNFSFIEQDLLQVEIDVAYGPQGTLRPDEFSLFFPSGWRMKKVIRAQAWSAGNPVLPASVQEVD